MSLRVNHFQKKEKKKAPLPAAGMRCPPQAKKFLAGRGHLSSKSMIFVVALRLFRRAAGMAQRWKPPGARHSPQGLFTLLMKARFLVLTVLAPVLSLHQQLV